MTDRHAPSNLALAAGLATVFGLVVEAVATIPVLVLAGALAFAGARRTGQTLIVALVLLSVAGIRVDASERISAPAAREVSR